MAVSPPASGDQDNTTTNQQADSNASNSGKGNSNDAPEPEPEPEPKQPDADPPKPERADREQMTADYQLDPVGAHRRYRDKTFEVEGYLYLIFTEGPHPHPAVSLVDDPTIPTNPALIRLEDAGLIDFLKAVQGEYLSVVLSAKCTGYSDKMLQFKEGELISPSAETTKARIEELLAQKDVAGVKAAEQYLALMTRVGVVDDEDVKALSSMIAAVRRPLAQAAKEQWVPVIRKHLEANDVVSARKALAEAMDQLLDDETANALGEELDAAEASQAQRRFLGEADDPFALYKKLGRTWMTKTERANGEVSYTSYEVTEVAADHAVYTMTSLDESKQPKKLLEPFVRTIRFDEKAISIPEGDTETVVVPAGTFECRLVESEAGGIKYEEWMSTKYPGLCVRRRMTHANEGVIEVVEFEE